MEQMTTKDISNEAARKVLWAATKLIQKIFFQNSFFCITNYPELAETKTLL
jgi:hypothetical protein